MEDAVANKVMLEGEKPAAPAANDDTLTLLVNYYEEWENETLEARKRSERTRDYYDGIQLTSAEIAELTKRGQPPLIFNHTKRKVNFLLGHEQERRTDPKAYPRNVPQDEEGAAAATDGLRYVQEDQDLPEKCSDVFEFMMLEGYGGVEVLYEPNKGCVDIKGWDWDRLFYDPHSSKHDFTDAGYLGGIVWMNEGRALAKYRDKAAVIEGTVAAAREEQDAGKSETHDDKPRNTIWVDFKRRPRLRIVQIYWNDDGKWKWAHYCKGGFLLGPMEVPFLDEDGAPECPMILQAAYVNRNNERYGEAFELLDRNDEINKRRSKMLHLMSVRQVMADEGAVDNIDKARIELARPDGYIEKSPGMNFEVLDTGNMLQGQAELLAEAKAEMEGAGPNAALMGKQGKDASGRAILASQQGGLTELARVMGRYKHFKTRVYRQVWNRIKQFWTDEKWVRVTDNERNIKFIGFNRKMTVAEAILAEAEAKGATPEDLQALQQAMVEIDPERAQADSGKLANNVAQMDMDIIIDDAPDTIVIQQEQFGEVVDLVRAGVPFDPEDLVEMSQLRNKDKVLKKMRERRESQAQTGAPPPEIVEAELRDKNAKAFKAEQEGLGQQIENADKVAGLQMHGPTPPEHVERQRDRQFDAAKTVGQSQSANEEAERGRQFTSRERRETQANQPVKPAK
jgi:hypothetical protein